MPNPFEAMAERQMTGAQKTKARVAQGWADKRTAREETVRMPTALEQKQMDDAVLAKFYNAYKREVRQEIQQRHGRDFEELARLLRNLQYGELERVVEYVAMSPWILNADTDTKFRLLGYIDSALGRAAVRDGRHELDDGLGVLLGKPEGPFIRIRQLMMGY